MISLHNTSDYVKALKRLNRHRMPNGTYGGVGGWLSNQWAVPYSIFAIMIAKVNLSCYLLRIGIPSERTIYPALKMVERSFSSVLP
ncbi:hypothetical protein HNR77_000536 [Paenibacillus sp. JGP012]|nr:hypothetical protein [Paenibacillus sp. JGP012]